MIKIFTMITFLIFVTLNSNSTAETSPDCSQYSSKTFTGLIDKMNCKKGKRVKERKKIKNLSDLNPFKPKDESGNVIPKKELACHEYSSKTFTGLIAKLKCEKKLGYK